jgi:ureidoacrylate peracid hydrolase
MEYLITANARPEPFTFTPAEAALLVIDMQNDFGAAGGAFDRAGIDIRQIRATLAPTRKVLAAARASGMTIIYLQMAYLPDLSDFPPSGSRTARAHQRFGAGQEIPAPDGSTGRILVRNTWNSAVLDELRPEPGDIQLYKPRFSGFFSTPLDDLLRKRGIASLFLSGCTTSVCVESTLRDASFRDYRSLVLEDCCAEPARPGTDDFNHSRSIALIEGLWGWVARSDDLVDALSSGSREAAA